MEIDLSMRINDLSSLETFGDKRSKIRKKERKGKRDEESLLRC
jgi:hypothetical protein